MNPPPWLQELRDLLAISSYDGRQEALIGWEQRWLVKLHQVQMISASARDHARDDLFTYADAHIRRGLGDRLAVLMVDLCHRRTAGQWVWGDAMVEVHGDVMAIRREPKTDD